MRVIKFKGKRIDNSKWVYGSLMVDFDGSTRIIVWESVLVEEETNGHELQEKCYEVDPGTVCGFIDRKAKCGKELFENDYIKCIRPSWHGEVTGFIKYDNSSWTVCQKLNGTVGQNGIVRMRSDGDNDWYSIENIEDFETEYLGNIIDNPELLNS